MGNPGGIVQRVAVCDTVTVTVYTYHTIPASQDHDAPYQGRVVHGWVMGNPGGLVQKVTVCDST